MAQIEEDRVLAPPTTSDIQWWWVEGRGEGVSRLSASDQFEKWYTAARADARAQALREYTKGTDMTIRDDAAEAVEELVGEVTAILSGHAGEQGHAEIYRDHILYGLDDEALSLVQEWLDREADRLRAMPLRLHEIEKLLRLDAQP